MHVGARVNDASAYEPTVLGAAGRHPLLIGIIAAAMAGLALLVAIFLLDDWIAEVSIIIEDPASSQVFDTDSARSPERFLAAQAEILRSSDMAQEVASLVNEDDALSVGEIQESRTIATGEDSDLLVVSFVHSDPQVATRYANAYAEAYSSRREVATAASFESAISGINASIATIDAELEQIDSEIEAITSVEGATDLEADLRQELEEAIARFQARGPNPESTQEIEEILDQLQTLQGIRSMGSQNPSLVILIDSRSEIADRRSSLIMRRDQLQVDAALLSTGIVAISEATSATRSTSTRNAALFGVALGVAIGIALAYRHEVRNRRFNHKNEPEMLLGLPLLSEVPVFSTKGSHERSLPVLSEPGSPAAEAFRFGALAILSAMGESTKELSRSGYLVAIASPLAGDGKTISSMNLALALTARGNSVLLVDADFADAALTRILLGDKSTAKGMTDVVEGRSPLIEVLTEFRPGNGRHLDVLTKGTVDIVASDFFGSPVTGEFLRILKEGYDFIILDTPPFIQVPYSASLLDLSDAVVTVVPHQGRVSVQRELANHLELVRTRAVGYIYNKSTKRSDSMNHRGPFKEMLDWRQPSAEESRQRLSVDT